MSRPAIREIVVVEGRDDEAAVARAADAVCIVTNGFGISQDTWNLIDRAYSTCGIIVLTDPDHAGEEIRRMIMARYPDAKQAFIARSAATRDGDVGVENASPEAILEALSKAHAVVTVTEESSGQNDITPALLSELGLTGGAGAAKLRAQAAEVLGTGYANGRTFAKRLQAFGISRRELTETVNGIKEKK